MTSHLEAWWVQHKNSELFWTKWKQWIQSCLHSDPICSPEWHIKGKTAEAGLFAAKPSPQEHWMCLRRHFWLHPCLDSFSSHLCSPVSYDLCSLCLFDLFLIYANMPTTENSQSVCLLLPAVHDAQTCSAPTTQSSQLLFNSQFCFQLQRPVPVPCRNFLRKRVCCADPLGLSWPLENTSDCWSGCLWH